MFQGRVEGIKIGLDESPTYGGLEGPGGATVKLGVAVSVSLDCTPSLPRSPLPAPRSPLPAPRSPLLLTPPLRLLAELLKEQAEKQAATAAAEGA